MLQDICRVFQQCSLGARGSRDGEGFTPKRAVSSLTWSQTTLALRGILEPPTRLLDICRNEMSTFNASLTHDRTHSPIRRTRENVR